MFSTHITVPEALVCCELGPQLWAEQTPESAPEALEVPGPVDGAPDGAQQGEGREGQRGEGGLAQQRGQMEAHQQEGEHSHQHWRWDTCAQLSSGGGQVKCTKNTAVYW